MATLDFQKKEKEILDFWEKGKIFQKSLEQRRGKKRFVFFEGPPTANGLPHIGHFLTRIYKDLYGRYKTMRGFFVLRKAGWDTHGLPVELEVEKQLGFKSKKDIEEYGIAEFNKKAKESVWKYKKEWEEMTERMGFWIDMGHPYVTYENPYIESLWRIFKKIWDKKLFYHAHKVVPFCTRCGTALSSHEVAQGYRTITDISAIIKFKVQSAKRKVSEGDVYLLAWTTTPWTLPGNVALAVGESIKYQVVSIKGKDERYILAEELVSKVLNTEYIIHNTISGSDLIGLEYESLFDVEAFKSPQSHKVYAADFVSTSEGTGIVHTAVMYGDDDYKLGTAVGLPKIHTVDEGGRFTGVGGCFDGLYVKNAETEEKILDHLRANGNLFKVEPYEHEYPFCWRCGTALLYYAKNSWFIKTTAVKDELITNNGKINWVPAHIKEGRFGQWLKELKDWAISRERYWGTPLPIWQCVKCGHARTVGAVKEIAKQAVGRKNTYYLMRHGISERDEKNDIIINSEKNSDGYHLTTEGKMIVENAVGNFARGENVDAIYCSPFLRTRETAEIAGKMLHREAKIDNRLTEIRHGFACEGKKHSACPFKDVKKNFEFKEDGGESWNDVRQRIMDFMQEIESTYHNKKILIVSHGDPLWLLAQIAEGRTDNEVLARRERGEDWYPSFAELKKLSWIQIPRNELGELDLHRPYIDSIVLRCGKCRAEMKRIPDIADVWFDSGAMPYAQWHWPFENKDIFKKQFPADFIVEGIDQTRGWFYTLLAVSTLLGKDAPYKNVMALGLALDEKGKKMSKSIGNVITPDEIMDQVGADATRWYLYTLNEPGDFKSISIQAAREQLKGFTMTLENCVRFYELYQSGDKRQATSDKTEITSENLGAVKNLLDKWIISRFQELLSEVTEKLDAYDPTTASRAIEKFVVDDFSQWWLRRSRKRKEALPLLRVLLLELAKILAPFIPFTAEDIHTRLHIGAKPSTESIHLHDWPKLQKKTRNIKLEEKMSHIREIITAGLAIRKEKQIKVRQPLKSAAIASDKLENDLEELIKEELNVRGISYATSDKRQATRPLVELDVEVTAELAAEGYARELMRQIQDMRKEAGYKLDQKIYCQWHSDSKELSAAILKWSDMIEGDTLLSDFINGPHDKKKYDVEKELELAPQMPIWVGIKK